jgi:phospholipid transport system substrate-binding protein
VEGRRTKGEGRKRRKKNKESPGQAPGVQMGNSEVTMRGKFRNVSLLCHNPWAAALLFAALLLLPVSVRAADDAAASAGANGPSAHDTVADTIDKVRKILADPAYKDSARQPALREQIRQTVLKGVDMDRIGTLTLAQYRKKFDDAQFRRFCDLFSRLVFTTYISHMEKYNGEKVIVLNTEKLAEDRVMVHSKTLVETGEVPVDYSLVHVEGVWKLYDVHIEGVSLVKNYQSQFGEILVNKKPDQLNENEANLRRSETPTPDLTAPKQGEVK